MSEDPVPYAKIKGFDRLFTYLKLKHKLVIGDYTGRDVLDQIRKHQADDTSGATGKSGGIPVPGLDITTGLPKAIVLQPDEFGHVTG